MSHEKLHLHPDMTKAAGLGKAVGAIIQISAVVLAEARRLFLSPGVYVLRSMIRRSAAFSIDLQRQPFSGDRHHGERRRGGDHPS
jgi:hypothetical protein